MKRTATPAILFLLVLCAWPNASAGSGDPLTFLVAFTPDSGRLLVASHRGGIKVLMRRLLALVKDSPMKSPLRTARV